MSNDLNRHECIGRLGKDPEIKYMPSGEAVCNISIACGEKWKDKSTGQQQERTTWINYVAFGRLAEIMGEYLKKGSRVFLSGKIRVRKWQDQSGADRYSTEIVASEMQMLDSRESTPAQMQAGRMAGGSSVQAPMAPAQQQQAPQQGYHNPPVKQAPPPKNLDSFEDDIPF